MLVIVHISNSLIIMATEKDEKLKFTFMFSTSSGKNGYDLKPPEKIGWICPSCELNNHKDEYSCSSCFSPKPGFECTFSWVKKPSTEDQTTDSLIASFKRKIQDFDDDQLNRVLKVAKKEYDRRHLYILIHADICDKDCYCIVIHRDTDYAITQSRLFSLLEKTLAFDNGEDSICLYFDFTKDQAQERINTMERFAFSQDCCEYWCDYSDIDNEISVHNRLTQHINSHWEDKETPKAIEYFNMLHILGLNTWP